MQTGLLTGDSGAPDEWDIFFYDFPSYISDDPSTDPVLNSRPIAHLEQADDLAEMSLQVTALQRKLVGSEEWANDNSAVISAPKSRWMLLGKMIQAQWRMPYFHLDGRELECVDHHAYVGIHFNSTSRRDSYFTLRYETRSQKAANTLAATFAVQDRIGPLLVREGRQLYMARIDPHLPLRGDCRYQPQTD
ncbi:hypothetical protein AAF712_016247 [Marasmius tenuissimus]|uniref:Uncharacterized protein n=1 Tax=Marasmius tenuissimus TaxID=585030 RepID=A0ABR2Z768_9AGAR